MQNPQADESYSLPQLIADVRAIAAATDDLQRILAQVRPLVQRAALAKDWLRPEHYTCDEAQGFGVHLLHEEPEHALAMFAMAWLPGRGAPPHDHGTWAVVAGVEGLEKNTFWHRVDDGTRDGYAEIVRAGEKHFGPGQVVSLLPDGIHSVENDTDAVTVSLHVYGMHINHTGRRRFDPATNAVERFVVTTR